MFRYFRWITSAAVCAVALAGCTSSEETSSDLEKRMQYQARLDTTPNRFDADFGISVQNGMMFVTKTMHQTCSKRCATFEEEPGGGFKVSLPIGFQAARTNPPKEAIANVSELVYWDPVRHLETALIGTADEPVPLPDTLVRRSLDDLKVNETAYIASSYIHPNTSGGWVVETGPIWYEPVGLEYNMTVTVRIMRAKDGVEVCTPANQPLNTLQTDTGMPVTHLTHSC